MGGCATKPKGLKLEAGEPPVPEPNPALVKEEEAGSVSEVKGEIVEVEKKIEVVDDDGEKVDEQGNKRRSLSLLFKENEEGKESTEVDKNPLEPTKEEPSRTEKDSEASEIKAPEAEKPEILIEQTPAPDVVDTPKTEEVVEAAPITETQKPETTEEKKIIEEKEKEEKGTAAENVKVL